MKVSIDLKKVLHLILLIVFTITFGQLLIQHYEWKPLSAYGLTCSLVCQISNAILKLKDRVSSAENNKKCDDDNDEGVSIRKMKKTNMKSRRVRGQR